MLFLSHLQQPNNSNSAAQFPRRVFRSRILFLLIFYLTANYGFGQTWHSQTYGSDSDINSLFFINSTTGWGVGVGGIIRKTTDAGRTWTAQTVNTVNIFNSVYFINASTGWAAGQGGIIYKTTDGGTKWVAQNSMTTTDI